MNRVLTAIAMVAFTLACLGVADAAQPPYELNVILSLTGPGAFLGTHIAQSYAVIEKLINAKGGIDGRPLKFVIADDATNPQTAVQLANAVIAKSVPVFLGPNIGGACGAVSSLAAKGGPVMYCLSPLLRPVAGSFVFIAMPTSQDMLSTQVRYFRNRGWSRLAIISSTDASGQDFDAGLASALALPENKSVEVVAHEHFNGSDLSVAAQISRMKSAAPQAVIVLTTGPALGTVLQAIHDAGLAGPVAAANSNMISAQLEQYHAFLPAQLFFAGFRSVTEGAAGPGPIREAQRAYFDAFRAEHVRPDIGNDVGWDAAMIVVSALKRLGPTATPEQVRSYISDLHDWVGINGVYDFRDGSQRGVGAQALVVDRFEPDGSRFVPVSRPAGYP